MTVCFEAVYNDYLNYKNYFLIQRLFLCDELCIISSPMYRLNVVAVFRLMQVLVLKHNTVYNLIPVI